MMGWQGRIPLASPRSPPEGPSYSTLYRIMGRCLEHMVMINFGSSSVWGAGKCEHFLHPRAQRNVPSGVETASDLQIFSLDIAETLMRPLPMAFSEYCPRIPFWEYTGWGCLSVASLWVGLD